MMAQRTTRSMGTFLLIWFGQLLSVTGTELTSFALGVWVFRETGSVTQFALISVSVILPSILIAMLAGTFADRFNRRTILIMSDLVAGLSTLILALLLATHRLEIWHIYISVAVRSLCDGFRSPALKASIPLLVPQQHLSRANGLMQMSQAAALIVPPLLAGLLVPLIQLQGVIMIDFATFLFALVTLLFFHIPNPQQQQQEARSFVQDMLYGWRYIARRPGLVGLLIMFAASNLLLGIVSVLITPLVLATSSTTALGTVLSMGGVGLLVGSVLMSVWGGPKRRMAGILGFMLLDGLCVMFGGVRPLVPLFAVSAFGFFFGLAILNTCSWTIWQTRVALDVQGRVFATLQMIALSSLPAGYLIAGPLADRVFEPLLAVNGPLAGSVGTLIGVGAGRGIGLLFFVAGLLMLIVTAWGYLNPRIRLLEDELPEVSPVVAGAAEVEQPDSSSAASLTYTQG